MWHLIASGSNTILISNQNTHTMKIRFSFNTALAQAWANQSQPEGKGNSMFFVNENVYSYGYHYVAGTILEAKGGQKVAIVNGTSYSVSTAKHVGEVMSASMKLYTTFKIPFGRSFSVDKLPAILEVMTKDVEKLSEKQLRARTSTHNFYMALHKVDDIKELSRLFDLPVPNTSSFKYFGEASANAFNKRAKRLTDES
jgi:hypothetical protein